MCSLCTKLPWFNHQHKNSVNVISIWLISSLMIQSQSDHIKWISLYLEKRDPWTNTKIKICFAHVFVLQMKHIYHACYLKQYVLRLILFISIFFTCVCLSVRSISKSIKLERLQINSWILMRLMIAHIETTYRYVQKSILRPSDWF